MLGDEPMHHRFLGRQRPVPIMQTRRLLFHGLESTSWQVLLAVVALVAVTCVVMLFRYERRLVSPRLGNTLLLLRVLTISSLFLVLLEPVASWSVDEERSGRVVVALDLSESMDTTDKQATASEKLRWARGLGMIGNADIDSRLDQWQASYERGEEPEWVAVNETADPEKRRALASSRQELVKGVFAELDRTPRREIAERLLTSGVDPLLPKLEKLAQVELCLFAGGSTTTESALLSERLAGQSGPTGNAKNKVTPKPGAKSKPGAQQPAPKGAKPKGGPGAKPANAPLDLGSLKVDFTDITQPLTVAASGTGTKLAGIVLITDGRDTAHGTSTEFVQRYAGVAPVYSVLIGSERRPKDLAIANVDHPTAVFQNDRPAVKATLRTQGFAGQDLEVILEERDADGKPIAIPEIPPRRLQHSVSETAVTPVEATPMPLCRHPLRLRLHGQPHPDRLQHGDQGLQRWIALGR